ncbi:hypothetical protein ACP70R_024460 [Stipagrostis hirtigluma subsp. patula]
MEMAAAGGGSVARCAAVLLAAALLFSAPTASEAYDSLDPNGNITIKWDIMSWTPDGYVAVVTMYNYEQFRHIQAPGWQLGWTWAKNEVIWSIVGANTTDQGDCSEFKGYTPQCCKKDPTIVDLLPSTPYNMQIANCCKAGVLSTFNQDPTNAAASFQISVGHAGTTNKTVKVPKNFTLNTPGPGYTCGRAIVGKPTKFFSLDGRRSTQALSEGSPNLQPTVDGPGKWARWPLVQCTSHMCPIRIHWHVKQNYKKYWRVKITITNYNLRMNYTQWNLVVQHPNFDNITQLAGLNYKALTPYGGGMNDTAMFWGVKFYNDLLMQAGKLGNVQSELLLRKDSKDFTFEKGWAFPRRVYFNGDNCVMPPPDAYPWLPNAIH